MNKKYLKKEFVRALACTGAVFASTSAMGAANNNPLMTHTPFVCSPNGTAPSANTLKGCISDKYWRGLSDLTLSKKDSKVGSNFLALQYTINGKFYCVEYTNEGTNDYFVPTNDASELMGFYNSVKIKDDKESKGIPGVERADCRLKKEYGSWSPALSALTCPTACGHAASVLTSSRECKCKRSTSAEADWAECTKLLGSEANECTYSKACPATAACCDCNCNCDSCHSSCDSSCDSSCWSGNCCDSCNCDSCHCDCYHCACYNCDCNYCVSGCNICEACFGGSGGSNGGCMIWAGSQPSQESDTSVVADNSLAKDDEDHDA